MAKRVGKLARRYAKALLRKAESDLGAALQDGLTPAQKLAAALQSFSDRFFAEPELRISIMTPMFKREERLQAFMAVANAAQLPELGTAFLRLLFVRDRVDALPEIAQAFRDQADAAAGVVPVEVVTASALGPEETAEVEAAVTKLVRGRPALSWSVDPELIGGMLLRYQGKVVDGSLRGRLEKIGQELKTKPASA